MWLSKYDVGLIKAQLTRIEMLLIEVVGKEKRMAATLDDLIAGVQQESTVDDSIIALLNNISAQLKAAGSDPAKIQQVNDAIQANIAKITAAVTANTPAAPANP